MLSSGERSSLTIKWQSKKSSSRRITKNKNKVQRIVKRGKGATRFKVFRIGRVKPVMNLLLSTSDIML